MIKAHKMKDGTLMFDNFAVIKKGKCYYAVVYAWYGEINPNIEYTSGPTLNSAAKKAKLLQMGYNERKSMEDDEY